MTVLFVLDQLTVGGLQKVNVHVANELGKHLDVKVYSLQNTANELEVVVPIVYGENSSFEHRYVQGLKSVNLLYRIANYKNSLIVIRYQVKKLINYIRSNGVTTIILSGPSILFITEIKKIAPEVNCVIWMHNTYEVYSGNYFLLSKEVFDASIKEADKIVCLTHADKLKYLSKNHNTIHINNPITISNSGKITKLNKKIISFVGSLNTEQKGLDYLVEISKDIPEDWAIHIAGDGKDKKFIEKNITNKFKLVGSLSGRSLEEHYLNSSIFISTSRWEGFGLVMTEAMSFGVPIIAFCTDGASEILLNGEYGIVIENGDTKKFVSEIQNMICYKDIQKKYSRKSIERSKDFEIKDITKQWLKLIEELE